MTKYFINKFLTVVLGSTLVLGILGCGGSEPDTTSAGSMSTPRWGHSATVLNDGKLLVVGGQERLSGRVATAEIYDPASNTWSAAANMIDPRGKKHSAVLLSDGKVMVMGDSETGTVEIYDPASNTWTATGSLNKPRNSITVTLLNDGRVLAAAGEDATKTGTLPLNTAEVWDPSTGEFSVTASMEQNHAGVPSVLVGDKVLVIGRYIGELYDPSTGAWSSAGTPNKERAQGAAAVVMNDGKVMITGGEFIRSGWVGANTVPLLGTEIYDPATSTWTKASNMIEPRKFHASAVLNDGRVIVVGPKDDNMVIDVYDPTSIEEIKWPTIGVLAENRGESYTASVLNDGRVIVVGGYFINEDKKTRAIATAEIFDPNAVAE
tara:strand:+ start:761 stop:1894 length:1134 start_codon:yes stop_codon:yes gene_type:complete